MFITKSVNGTAAAWQHKRAIPTSVAGMRNWRHCMPPALSAPTAVVN